jgi:iturin family lipopeptide synthetase B
MICDGMKLDRSNVENILPLTNTQEGILFHYLMNREKNEYFEQLSIGIRGNIDFEVFKSAWIKVIQSNEMLRTVFRWENIEKAVQIILKSHDVHIQYNDFRNSETSIFDLEEIKVQDRKIGFDLRNVPFRIMLCHMEDDKYEMVISSHHILYDGWSTGVLLKEFSEFYSCLIKGKEPFLQNKTKYAEFIKWNRQNDDSTEKLFWEDYLKSYVPLEELPIKKVCQNNVSTYANSRLHIEESKGKKIKNFLQTNQLTLASLIYSAWGILLQRYHNSDDITFGTVVSGRNCPISNIENVIGLFINTLVTRVKTDENKNIIELCKKINNNIKEKTDYEKTPLINIKKYMQIDNNKDFFESVVVIDNYPVNMMTDNGLFSIETFVMNETSNYDLTLGVMERNVLELSLTYNAAKFNNNTIVEILNHLGNIIQYIIENPLKKVIDIEMLSFQEIDKMLHEKNIDSIDTEHTSLVELFEKHAKENIHVSAIINDKGEEISYKDLNEVSNRISNSLLKEGAITGESAVIMMGDACLTVISMLGILKSGGVFTCIDTEYPEERINTILNELLPSKILIDTNVKNINLEILNRYAQKYNCDIFMISDEIKNLEHPGKIIYIHDKTISADNPSLKINPEWPAYIVYTSGSTGQPKGIIQSHKSFCQFLGWQSRQFNILKGECFFQWAATTYDASYCEIFGSLCFGASLFITEKFKRYDPLQLVKLLEEKGVSILQVVPSYFRQILTIIEEEGKCGRFYLLDKLKNILLAGERIPPEIIWRWKKIFQSKHKITNLYGPTETVLATYYPIADVVEENTPVYVGKAIDGRRILILDKHMRLCPINVPGEVYIQSRYLTTGYYKNPNETNKRFLKDPIAPFKGADVYRTGDIGRLLQDGNIEFLGRADKQIKINGMRVELNEIEKVINRFKAVSECAIVQKEVRKNHQMQLIAYIVPKKEFNLGELRNFLKNILPGYMLPHMYGLIEKLPRTHSNKIDTKKLIQMEDIKFLEINEEKILPKSEMEKEISLIWSKLLGVDEIGIDENFFEIGGHSLMAMQLTNRLRSKYQQNITLKDFFKDPTIRGVVKVLGKSLCHDNVQEKIAQNLKKIMSLSDTEISEQLKNINKYKKG